MKENFRLGVVEVLGFYFEDCDTFELVKDIVEIVAEEVKQWHDHQREEAVELFIKIAKGE